jgi:hypothetical protein
MEPESPATPTPQSVISATVADRPPAEAALALAELAGRVVAELNKLARAQAEAHRGQPDWGRWAKLANATRSAVLQVATCRDAARELQRQG